MNDMTDINIAGFEAFQNEGLTRVVDKITITKVNQFNFPTAMYKRNKLHRYSAVRIYFNRADMQVGLEFLNEYENGSFKLILSEEGRYGAYIVAKSFFFFNELEAKQFAGRYGYKTVNLSEMDAKRLGVMYIIDLKDKGGDL
jgi:hypothetical protein